MPETENASGDQAVFVARCTSDVNFLTNAVAAVLSNDETKTVFNAELQRQSATSYPTEGVKLVSPTKISYNLRPVAGQYMDLGLKPSPGQQPSGQLTLLAYNGSEWSGLLVEAGKLVRYLPLGLITTALVQALFGTKAGAALLAVLLLL